MGGCASFSRALGVSQILVLGRQLRTVIWEQAKAAGRAALLARMLSEQRRAGATDPFSPRVAGWIGALRDINAQLGRNATRAQLGLQGPIAALAEGIADCVARCPTAPAAPAADTSPFEELRVAMLAAADQVGVQATEPWRGGAGEADDPLEPTALERQMAVVGGAALVLKRLWPLSVHMFNTSTHCVTFSRPESASHVPPTVCPFIITSAHFHISAHSPPELLCTVMLGIMAAADVVLVNTICCKRR
eukprot:COSAG01_NODE_8796_length_2656_cov_4.895190_1_plen_248_part_00